MDFSKDDLKEAKRQIDSTLHKLRQVVKTFEAKENSERYHSQITLAKRRIKAFEIANWLIEEKLKKQAISSLSGRQHNGPFLFTQQKAPAGR